MKLRSRTICTNLSSKTKKYIPLKDLCREKKKLSFPLKRIYQKIIGDCLLEEPSIAKILQSNIPEKLKIQCLHIYADYKSYLACPELQSSGDAYRMITKINEIIKNNTIDSEYVHEHNILISSNTSVSLRQKVLQLNTTPDNKSVLLKKVEEYEKQDYGNEKDCLLSILHEYLQLPYKNSFKIVMNNQCELQLFLQEVSTILNKELYGMKTIKEKLLISLVQKISNPSTHISLGFEGPPGVGKTAIVSAFSKAIHIPFERISLGGTVDSSIFKGSASVWVGSTPSVILKILQRMKVNNGIILFDEIDKISYDKNYDVINSLIHLTDYTQNSEYTDTYPSDFTHDISQVSFMYSMNDSSLINSVLRDRLNIIKIPDYSKSEKKIIIRDYVIPKICNTMNCKFEVCIQDSVLDYVVSFNYSVRTYQRLFNDIISYLQFNNLTGRNVKAFLDGTESNAKGDNAESNTEGSKYITKKLIDDFIEKKKEQVLTYFI